MDNNKSPIQSLHFLPAALFCIWPGPIMVLWSRGSSPPNGPPLKNGSQFTFGLAPHSEGPLLSQESSKTGNRAKGEMGLGKYVAPGHYHAHKHISFGSGKEQDPRTHSAWFCASHQQDTCALPVHFVSWWSTALHTASNRNLWYTNEELADQAKVTAGTTLSTRLTFTAHIFNDAPENRH